MITDLITKPIKYVHIHDYELVAFLNGDVPDNFIREDDDQCFYINHNRPLDYCHVFQIKGDYPVYHGMTRFVFMDAFSNENAMVKIADYVKNNNYHMHVHNFMTALLNRTFAYTYSDLKDNQYTTDKSKLMNRFFG